jgi:hypothetical protein
MKSRYTDGLRAGRWGFDSRQGQDLSILHRVQTGFLGSTQTRIQCVPGAISPQIKRPERDADDSPPSSAGVKNYAAVLPLHVRTHGMVLN